MYNGGGKGRVGTLVLLTESFLSCRRDEADEHVLCHLTVSFVANLNSLSS